MKYIDEDKVNWAIRDCLEACYKSKAVLPKMAEFLAELKARGDWREAEIREVEVAVLKVLHGVVRRKMRAVQSTNEPVREMQPTGSRPVIVHRI